MGPEFFEPLPKNELSPGVIYFARFIGYSRLALWREAVVVICATVPRLARS